MKQRVVSVLRATGLLSGADWVRYRLDESRNRSENERFRTENRSVITPPLDFLYEVSGSTSLNAYWRDGRRLADTFWRLVSPHLPPSDLAVCEWGCGIGRIVRHLGAASDGKVTRVAGMDYNPRMVSWCAESIPEVEFRQNS